MGFPASACISVNEEIIHGIPGKRVIKSGDLVSIDLGIIRNGFFSDAAQTIAVGECAPRALELNDVTRKCLDLAIEQVKPGNRIHDISRAVFRCAKQHGFEVVREYCGHGVGLSLHEEPQIPNYVSVGPNPRLRKGMILAIEPMINMGTAQIQHLDDDWTVVTRDGKPSAHWEHTVLVTEDGVEILTAL
jgi:methionyl aminopeptidase